MTAVQNFDFLQLDLTEISNDYSLIYIDPPYGTGRDFGEYKDNLDSASYKEFMTQVFERVSQLTKNTTVIVQCDWHQTHIIRTIGDQILGAGKYSNEIIWNYNSGGGSKRRPSRKHDTLHVWCLGDYTYNEMREPYPHKYANRENVNFHPDGRVIQDVWNDIPFIGTSSKERTGYPTQKPLKLMQRIIEIWSDPGQTLLDPMCGSGSFGVAAQKLGRHPVLLDKMPNAVSIAEARINSLK